MKCPIIQNLMIIFYYKVCHFISQLSNTVYTFRSNAANSYHLDLAPQDHSRTSLCCGFNYFHQIACIKWIILTFKCHDQIPPWYDSTFTILVHFQQKIS